MRVSLSFCLVCLLACSALQAQPLPAALEAALSRAKIGRDALSIYLADAEQPRTGAATPAPRLAHRAEVAMNPASVMKLVTTYAALDLLGPAYTWPTTVYADGTLHQGQLQGSVYIRGQGDPKLVQERLWLLLRRLQGAGIRSIAGDIVLDRSAFEAPSGSPADFDGEPLRPYNVAPDALLVNFKSLALTFTPEPRKGLAHVQADPPLLGVQIPATVALGAPGTDCGDYRGALRADFSDATRVRFLGVYPPGCGEKTWPIAYADPGSFAPRAIAGMWSELGGKLTGSVHYGTVPAALLAGEPTMFATSPPLAEVVRDINKFSNNVMAQQLFLTLGEGSFAAARTRLQRWWKERIDTPDAPVLDNGSGLSRQERISAQALGRMLHIAYRSAHMSELMSSLPITGVDGTLRRAKGLGAGSAHLKTGSLNNVIARAGYVDAASGKRYVLVALINHANANTPATRAALDALLEWTIQDQ